MAPHIREKSIELTCAKTEEEGGIKVEEAAMIQILMNIILNAVDAVPPKGKIHISHYPESKGYRIDIADNAPGIAPENGEKVFESFVSFKEDGTGLGLSITRKIVERLGGTIGVTPSDMGGAKFTVFLPDSNALTN